MRDVDALLGLTPLRRRADGLTADHPQRPPLPATGLTSHAGLRLVTLLGLFFVGWNVLLMAVALGLPHIGPRAGVWLSATCQVVPAVVAYVVVARWLEGRRPPVELAGRRAGGLVVGIVLGAALLLTVLGVLALMGAWVPGAWRPAGEVSWHSTLAIAGVQAAVTEELAFRGVLLRLLEEWCGTWGALAVSAAVFGAAHLMTPHSSPWTAGAIALEAGVLFGALYVLTRSLWVLVGLHAAWNVTQALATGVVSGNPTHGWLAGTFRGPAWLTGGAYGVEASVVTVALLAGVAMALLAVARRRGLVVAPARRRPR